MSTGCSDWALPRETRERTFSFGTLEITFYFVYLEIGGGHLSLSLSRAPTNFRIGLWIAAFHTHVKTRFFYITREWFHHSVTTYEFSYFYRILWKTLLLVVLLYDFHILFFFFSVYFFPFFINLFKPVSLHKSNHNHHQFFCLRR